MTKILPALMCALTAVSGCTQAEVWFNCAEGEPLCEERLPATGVSIRDLVLYQGVETLLVEDGAAVEPDLPVVAGREALLRVMLDVDESFATREIVGRLYVLDEGGFAGGLESSIEVVAGSEISLLESSLNFTVPGEMITPSSRFLLRLLEASPASQGSEPEGLHTWPDDEEGFSLPVAEHADVLRIHLIPVEYNADGSGRLPDLSEEQIEIYRSLMWAVYPASEVEVLIGDPLPWDSTVSASGSGWDQLLSAVGQVRQERDIGDDEYLYGLFNPADNIGQFCGGGCVVGLSNLAGSAQDAFNRASIGVGFPGQDSAWTMVHEVGHAHGRLHSPCGGAASPEPDYPYKDGDIGVRGYDLAAQQLKEAGAYKDFMGYCSPNWLSDFTYVALFDRIHAIGALMQEPGPEVEGRFAAPRSFADLWISPDDELWWSEDLSLRHAPGGEPVEVELLDVRGELLATVSGRYTPFGDLPGGRIVLPVDDLPVDRVRVDGRLSPRR